LDGSASPCTRPLRLSAYYENTCKQTNCSNSLRALYSNRAMTPEDEAQLQQSIDTIAQILYRDTPAEQLQTLEGIEQTIRRQTQAFVLPQLGVFLLQQRLQQLKDTSER
ncbi:MAG: hypothetical protein MUF72_10650, partial [Elainella sp. Prado103]|nr:hypothetical protein [Elainella sp. Prado103]